ncbi:response regulator transcription factor [Paenibacillus eucommiae]|uniref:YesN/AraC family two-component response regulator n=1 Tax=Paenibacillus eucommiae TaxID=1355755 RepID=A0ABS4J1W0_9BACL|nr:response regulator [Paenibacillus eucommiae]MBP1993807.1 YesN/AraC family two-component response regulator [Paenibacillus eucommiae]
MKLMIVDDEPIILTGLNHMIRNSGLQISEVVTAADGEEAIAKLDACGSFRPDLIITDIHMPEMNGLELIEYMREKQLCRHFVILTGYDEFEYARRAIKNQVIDYLLKPINKQELFSILTRVAGEIKQAAVLPAITVSKDAMHKSAEPSSLSQSIKKTIQYIETNYHLDLTLDDAAGYVNLHPNYVSALFKKETGLSYLTYLNSYRVQKAQESMIKHPDKSLTEIAESVGFMNPRQFYKVFKKFTGFTPGHFRSQWTDSALQ